MRPHVVAYMSMPAPNTAMAGLSTEEDSTVTQVTYLPTYQVPMKRAECGFELVIMGIVGD